MMLIVLHTPTASREVPEDVHAGKTRLLCLALVIFFCKLRSMHVKLCGKWRNIGVDGGKADWDRQDVVTAHHWDLIMVNSESEKYGRAVGGGLNCGKTSPVFHLLRTGLLNFTFISGKAKETKRDIGTLCHKVAVPIFFPDCCAP